MNNIRAKYCIITVTVRPEKILYISIVGWNKIGNYLTLIKLRNIICNNMSLWWYINIKCAYMRSPKGGDYFLYMLQSFQYTTTQRLFKSLILNTFCLSILYIYTYYSKLFKYTVYSLIKHVTHKPIIHYIDWHYIFSVIYFRNNVKNGK